MINIKNNKKKFIIRVKKKILRDISNILIRFYLKTNLTLLMMLKLKK